MLTLWIQHCISFCSKVNCITALQNLHHFCFLHALLLTLSHGNLLIHRRQKNHWVLLYFIMYFEYTDNTWHMLFRNSISQKEFFISFSQWALTSRWELFFFMKRNKYKKISTTTQWRYFGFTFLYYRINSTQRFYNH